MKLRDIAVIRLRNQRIVGRKVDRPEDVVAWFGAVQSQEFPYAKWSLGKRMASATESAVDRAFADGSILRTHVLRPTWHFLAAADSRWILTLTAPRVHASQASMYRKLELADVLPKSLGLLARALAGGRHHTRRELQALLAANGIEAAGQRLAYIVMHAELECVLCSGPLRGKQHTYALFEERAPHALSLPGDEALAELTRRYFTSHGPATVRDYAWWSSLTMPQARRGLEMIDNGVERLSVGGRTYWFVDSALEGDEPKPTTHLMQGYDEYIVAYSESRDALWADAPIGSGPRMRPPFTHAVIIDNQLAGHWRRMPHASVLVLEVEMLRRFSTRELSAMDAAADRYRAFLGSPAFEIRYVSPAALP
jgi:hypothetical protein